MASTDTLQRYQPKTEHKGRPDGLQPIINRLPDSIETIITWHAENVATPITPFARRFFQTKRRQHMLQNMIRVYSVLLDWCQVKADGLVGVPHGSKRGKTNYLPMTKNKRCDTEEDSKDYMYGIACLAGVCERSTFNILGFFRGLGMAGHDGWENHPNNDHHSIRISKYGISMNTRSRLFNLSDSPAAWRERYEKKDAKVKAKAASEPTPPRPPLFRAGTPEGIAEKVSNRMQQVKDGLKISLTKTKEELLAELEALGRPIMPQGP